MKIELFDMKAFIETNRLKEITSPILFQRGDVPDPDGLISNDIFGVDVRSRKNNFAYIKLNGHFFHPHVYKTFKRLYRNIERIINGAYYYSIDQNGKIYEDPNGETGLESIYNNWNKIKWEYSEDSGGMRNERIDILTKSKKNEVFIEYFIVIPAFYRDVKSDQNGGGETEPVNNMYSKLIRFASMLKGQDMFDFTLHSTYYNTQNLLVEIYDYFKNKLAKKNGMIRKFLMGKNIDYCSRSVISTPNFHSEHPSEMIIDFKHIGIPISQICSLCQPLMMKWLKDWFEHQFILTNGDLIVDAEGNERVRIKNPESYFNEEYIKKLMNQYIRNPECRFDPITAPTEDGKFVSLRYSGSTYDPHSEAESTIVSRDLTITDLLYMAAVDVTKDKYALITRYPVSDSYGVFLGKVRVTSTLQVTTQKVNSQIFKFYPRIQPDVPKLKIATLFSESIQFSNSYLKGIGGDYDGDQITCKILWSQEANEEIKHVINSPSYYIKPTGENIRVIGNEGIQTLYALTKEPPKVKRPIPDTFTDELLSLTSKDIHFEFLLNLFAKRKDGDKVDLPKYHPTDIMTIKPMKYNKNKNTIVTTIGRFIFNKLLLEDNRFIERHGYQNIVVNAGGLKDIEKKISADVISGAMTPDEMGTYIDYRDWIGLQLHAVITSSFTPNTIKIPKEVEKLKEELFKKYKKELDSGDIKTAEKIEKELIKKTKEVLDGDVGLDLYYSGARGSIDNNLKNIILMRGAVLNPITKKYDIVQSSLMDGMKKNEIPDNANAVVLGAYPKAVFVFWLPLNRVNFWNP